MNFESLRSRISVLVLAALALGGVVMAQGGQKPQGGGAPMLIDFTAVGADGKPLAELAPADVTIRIGGKPRTITGLELKKVQASAAPAPAAGAPAAAAAPGDITPPFSTNEVSAAPAAPAASAGVNRSVLIVIDTESLPAAAESGFKAAISTLLEGLSPGDRVALATAPRDTAQVGFGTSLARVREALTAVKGQRSASVSTYDSLCRTSQTLSLLSSLIQPLAANSTPTAVVFIGGGLSVSGRDSGSAGTCEVVAGDYRRVVDMAAESRANMFIVQGDSGAMGRDNGLEQLAGDSGAGAVMRVTGEGIAPRVLASVSNYWVATLAPDPSDRPGQAQRLEVKAVKEGVTIGARAMAAPSRVAMAGPAAAGAAKPAGSVSPKDMLASQAQFTDLQLRAYAFAQRGLADKVTVFVQVEPVDPAVKLTAVRVGYFDAANKGGALDAPKIGAYPVTTLLPLLPGQYRIRVAAQDSTGKSGAVDINLNANLATAGPFKISGLLTGAAEGNTMLPRFVFSSEETIRAMFELYGPVTADSKMRVGFEIAPSDSAASTEAFPPIGVAPTNEPDKFQVYGEISIKDLKPGDYVIRAVVQQEGQPEGKSLRTIRKVAK